ncbi:hypothetical protein BJY00DRAFT_35286 [Aspergillus carlsbadensis]|nr:hypothetical protein BJY00DRAFT_35286 [Aspergillus carlsbadensis]
MQKLHGELEEVLDDSAGDVVAPCGRTKYLPYVRTCLDESLHPAIFGRPRRTPAEGATVLDDFIPGHTSVSISAYVVHYNECITKNQDVYRLERWLGELASCCSTTLSRSARVQEDSLGVTSATSRKLSSSPSWQTGVSLVLPPAE